MKIVPTVDNSRRAHKIVLSTAELKLIDSGLDRLVDSVTIADSQAAESLREIIIAYLHKLER